MNRPHDPLEVLVYAITKTVAMLVIVALAKALWKKEPASTVCRVCGQPRPAGYTRTCGRSECQAADAKGGQR